MGFITLNQLKLKTFKKLPSILEESMEYNSNYLRQTERSQHVTSWTWKHLDFDQLCSKISLTLVLDVQYMDDDKEVRWREEVVTKHAMPKLACNLAELHKITSLYYVMQLIRSFFTSPQLLVLSQTHHHNLHNFM